MNARVGRTMRRARTQRPGGTGRPGWWLPVVNAVAVVILLVLLFNVHVDSEVVRVGQPATDTILAQHRASYVDLAATNARRRQVASGVPAIYKLDRSGSRARLRLAERFLSEVGPSLVAGGSADAKLTAIRDNLPSNVQSSELQQLADLSSQDFKVVQQQTLSLLGQAEFWQYDANEIPSTVNALMSTVGNRENYQQRNATRAVLAAFLQPTLVPDIAATIRAQRAAAARVTPIINTINPGDIVVERGQMVTPSIVDKLTALGLQRRQSGWQDILGSALFASTIVGMLFWYLRAAASTSLSSWRLFLLIDVTVVAAVLGARVVANGHALLPYFLPVAAAPTFAAVLLAPDACIAVTLATAVLAGWVVANSFELTVYYFVTSAAGVLSVRHVRRLRQFIIAGVYVSGVAIITQLAFQFVDRTYDLTSLQDHFLAGAANGFVSCSLALGGFTMLSEFFGVTTMLQLLELAQPNQPLLRRLMVQAPGTYNHSILLSTMVERAAEEIGADSLAAKVGALYHDVGKSTNAECFVENQLGIGNIHDELAPEESVRIIRAHVTQGLRLARQYKLPHVIANAIAEHHGTTSIGYFLHKARELNPDVTVDMRLFTYAGPKPQSRETALIMLGDGCESAVRASSDHSRDRIASIVTQIFQERIRQGQLAESPLTLRDLEIVREAFCSVLNGLYHPRIEYPEAPAPLQQPQPSPHEPSLEPY